MKPQQNEVNQLLQLLGELHSKRLLGLVKMGESFGKYVQTLVGFQFRGAPLAKRHVGVVIVDWVLQQGHDWEKQVKPAVKLMEKRPEAKNLSGFIQLLESQPLGKVINFREDSTKNDLLQAARFLRSYNIDSFESLRQWTESWKNRDKLMKFVPDPNGALFRMGNKTADYIRVVIGHWDAVAVDTNMVALLRKGIPRTKLTYTEKRAIIQLAALSLQQRPIDLDVSIYDDSVHNPNRYNTQGG